MPQYKKEKDYNECEEFKSKSKGLYFIHGAYSSNEYYENLKHINTEEIVRDRLILLKDNADIINNIDNVYDIDALDIKLPYNYFQEEFSPGQFVYYNGDEKIESAEDDLAAIISGETNKVIVESIKNNDFRNYILHYKDKQYDSECKNITDVHSFHINVGHGNCSIILFKRQYKYEMWMIDCSVFDFMNKTMHSRELKKCLDDIYSTYGVRKISKLLITHLHYDHINGIPYLVKNKYIDNETEVWINLQYPWRQATYTKILLQLNALGVKFVNPVIDNSTNNIHIIYPSKSFNAAYPAPRNNINNASVLYQIILNGKCMLFTGDIETEGWDNVNCFPSLKNSNYYCISHHGSITGHIRNKGVCGMQNDSVKICASNTKVQILMGRNGAYRGIFNDRVLSEFSNLHRTDKVNHYIELEWDNRIVTNY